jgi:hypothetical protein
VAVEGLQAVVVTQDDEVAIAATVVLCQSHTAVKWRINRV